MRDRRSLLGTVSQVSKLSGQRPVPFGHPGSPGQPVPRRTHSRPSHSVVLSPQPHSSGNTVTSASHLTALPTPAPPGSALTAPLCWEPGTLSPLERCAQKKPGSPLGSVTSLGPLPASACAEPACSSGRWCHRASIWRPQLVDVAHSPSLGRAGRLGDARKGRGPRWWEGMGGQPSWCPPQRSDRV